MNNYEWDERKRQENAEKHEIDFTAIYNFEWDTVVQRSNTTLRRTALGSHQLYGDRLYTVVYTWRDDRRRIISLRRASRHEERAYAQA